jgi:hypothetical protein
MRGAENSNPLQMREVQRRIIHYRTNEGGSEKSSLLLTPTTPTPKENFGVFF